MLTIILLLSFSTKRSLAFIEPTNICHNNIVSFRSTPSSCEICSCSSPFSTVTSGGCQNLERELVENPFKSISNLDIQCPKPAQCASTEPNATTWYLGPGCPTCTCDATGVGAAVSRTEIQTWNGLSRCIASDCVTYDVSNLFSRCSANNSTKQTNPLINETKIIRVPRYDVGFFQPMWVAADLSGDKSNVLKPYICLSCQLQWTIPPPAGTTGPNTDLVIRRPTYSSLFFVNGDGQTSSRDIVDPTCDFAYCEQVVSTRAQWKIAKDWRNLDVNATKDFGIDPITNTTISVFDRVFEYCDLIGWEEWNHCRNVSKEWVLNADQCTGQVSDKLLYDVCPRCSCAYSNLKVGESTHKYYNVTSYKNNTKLTKYYCDLCTCNAPGKIFPSSRNFTTCTRVAEDYAPFECPPKTIKSCNGMQCVTPSIENTCMIEEAVHWTDFNLYSTDAVTKKSACAHSGLCDVFGVSNTGKCVSADININSEASGLQVWNCSNQHINDYRKPIVFKARLMCNNQTASNKTVDFPAAADSCPVDATYQKYLESVLKCAYTNQDNWLQDVLQYVSCDTGTRWAFLNSPCGDPDITIFLNEFTRCMCNGLKLIVDEKGGSSTERMANVKLLNSYFDWKVRKLLNDMKLGGCSASLTCDSNSATFKGKFATNVLRFNGGFPVNQSKINRTLAMEIIGKDLGGIGIDKISMSLLPTPAKELRVQVPVNKTYLPFNYTSLFRIRVRYERKSDALQAMEWLKMNRNMTGNIAIQDSWSVLPLTHELSSPQTSGFGRVVLNGRVWGIVVLLLAVLL